MFAHVSSKDAGQLVLSLEAPQADCTQLLYLLKSQQGSASQVATLGQRMRNHCLRPHPDSHPARAMNRVLGLKMLVASFSAVSDALSHHFQRESTSDSSDGTCTSRSSVGMSLLSLTNKQE